jgi:hypothetical protein
MTEICESFVNICPIKGKISKLLYYTTGCKQQRLKILRLLTTEISFMYT